jgi:hypothetical protein
MLKEDTAEWYAQDKAANVWYFGNALITTGMEMSSSTKDLERPALTQQSPGSSRAQSLGSATLIAGVR